MSSTTYTPDQQATIDGLLECQKHLGLTNSDFAKKYLRSYTESTWSKLSRGEYKAKEVTKTFVELSAALSEIRRRIQRQVKQTQGSPFHETDQFKALFLAVSECLVKKGEDRLIFYVAKTGEGKSRFISELTLREIVTTTRASEPWRESYYNAALDVLAALKVEGKFMSPAAARRAMLEKMKNRVEVLAIDEGNYFGPRSINLMKDVLNETEWTVIIALVPEAFAKMKRHYSEWQQLQRRVHIVFQHGVITAKDAATFLADAGLNGSTAEASKLLATAANEFGGYNFITRVIERVESNGEQGHRSLQDVESAIEFVQKQLALV